MSLMMLFSLLFQKSIVQTCLFCAAACHVIRSFYKMGSFLNVIWKVEVFDSSGRRIQILYLLN